jgi:hypothetical protein
MSLWRQNFFLFWSCGLTRAMATSFTKFLDHTQRVTTVGRTPLDEWSACRRDLYRTERHPVLRLDSIPRSQQDSGLKLRGHWDRLRPPIPTWNYWKIFTMKLTNRWTYCLEWNKHHEKVAKFWSESHVSNGIFWNWVMDCMRRLLKAGYCVDEPLMVSWIHPKYWTKNRATELITQHAP